MWWRKLSWNPGASGCHRCAMAAVLTVVCSLAAAADVTQPCVTGSAPFRLTKRQATKLLLDQERPVYPPLASINYIYGKVQLLVTVNCQGRVQQVHVLSGHPFLAVAALRAIRNWIYRPFETKRGRAAFQTRVNVNFSLLSRDIKDFPPDPEKFLAHSVHPPQAPREAADAPEAGTVQMRVLVSAKGRAMDSVFLSGTPAQFRKARKIVAHWHFKPARWGNLAVPWYLEVGVPVDAEPSRDPELSKRAQP